MLPLVDIAYLAEELRSHSEDLVAAFEDRDDALDSDPGILVQALSDLFDNLRLVEVDAPGQESMDGHSRSVFDNLGALGDYGIDLLARLAAQAASLKLPQRAQGIEELALPLACWIARRGGELEYLGPVVNGAATLANRLEQPSDLGQLYALLTEVVNAVNPQIPQDETVTAQSRSWRVLLLNRAIVATRSHRPELMEESFESIVEYLPDEAPKFFREGMEQMEALSYPPHVRVVMQRYHEEWCSQRVLH